MEIIKRVEGQKAEKQTIEEGHPQISFNSDGKLVVRQIYQQAVDILIVLDRTTSEQIIDFILQTRNTFENRERPF